jgi:hypothetical protein
MSINELYIEASLIIDSINFRNLFMVQTMFASFPRYFANYLETLVSYDFFQQDFPFHLIINFLEKQRILRHFNW